MAARPFRCHAPSDRGIPLHSPLDRGDGPKLYSGAFWTHPDENSAMDRLFGALLLALRFGLWLAALRLVAAFGRFHCLALILALRHLVFLFGRSQNLHRAAGLPHRGNR